MKDTPPASLLKSTHYFSVSAAGLSGLVGGLERWLRVLALPAT